MTQVPLSSPKTVNTSGRLIRFHRADQIFNPEMLSLARKSRGLSMVELATKMKVETGLISKVENGISDFTEDLTNKASGALDYPVSFFKEWDVIVPVTPFYQRNSHWAQLPDEI